MVCCRPCARGAWSGGWLLSRLSTWAIRGRAGHPSARYCREGTTPKTVDLRGGSFRDPWCSRKAGPGPSPRARVAPWASAARFGLDACESPRLAWAGRGGGDGRFHRVRERRRRGAPQGPGGHGPLRASWPWLPAGSTSATATSNSDHGAPGPQERPAYRAGRTLRTRASLLTDAQAQRLENLFADERHVPIQATWGVYQRLIQAYRTEDPSLGKYLMQRLIDSLKRAIPDGLKEIQALARTLTERASDTPGPLSTAPVPPTAPPTPSTGAWSTYAASPWDSATSPATPSAASSTPDASKTT